MKDKKNLGMAIIVTFLIIVLIIALYSIFTNKNLDFSDKYKSLYESIDYSKEVIKENMDEISVTNDNEEWVEMKAISNKDTKLKETYDSLIKDINTCYIELYAAGKLSVMKFKTDKKISVKDLNNLNDQKNCLKNFDKYYSLQLSDNERLSERMKKQLKIIISYTPEENKKLSFEELITNKAIDISKIESLSKWLKIEYLSNK